ncbi:MAG: hypothetical protein HY698_09310 [Deltaproteobacteria bacterium]|nr:hypothetical protein [Deltaproteobacteria bacterium]
MSRMARFVLGVGCVAMSMLSPTRDAGAGSTDDKSYPAFMCLESGSETGDFNRSEYRITRTGSAGSGVLLCPLVRDAFSSPSVYSDYDADMTVEVTLQDNHFREDITCTVINKLLSDGSAFSYKSATTEGASTTAKKLTMKGGFALQGYSFLKCQVPTNGTDGWTRIFAYKALEGAL